mgnify:CR=1 FL=1
MAKKGKTKATTRKAPAKPSTQAKTTATSADRAAGSESAAAALPFSRMNYILLLIGIGVIALGFILMSTDDFVDATQFSISLYIAPPITMIGFLSIIYAIMYKPKQSNA